MKITLRLTFFLVFLLTSFSLLSAASLGILPLAADDKPLNLDFEDGTLKDWRADGKAFDMQPIKGDTVYARRQDMKSGHQGDYWVGTFETFGDDATGTLTSVPFKVTHRYASFLVGGGSTELTRVELARASDQEVVFKVSGFDSENLRPVVIDLQPHLGQQIFIRIIDRQIGGWGHINFDDFRFYPAKPDFPNAIDPAKVAKQAEMPPVDAVKFAGLSPEAAAKEMTLPAGFKATLFAGEPDVKQPIAFAIDDRGRLWVAEAYTYPKRAPEGEGRDRILIFEDTDGDGKFNKRIVFMENLNLVSGLEVGFGGVWVGAAPYLMFISDKNGDDKPDGEPQILLDGWDFKTDTHETLNTFNWGPDGWLYGCHGVFCPSFVGKPGTPANERQRVDAAVWRYHPIKHRFEVFAEGTSNPWGIDFDEYGQCIIEACVIPHLWHMIQGGRYERQGGQHYNISSEETRDHERSQQKGGRRHINPFIFDDIKTIAEHVHYSGNKGPHAGNSRSDAAGGGHAHAGLMIYLGDSWPDQYRGKAFMNNIHGQRLNMDILERQGSGYVGHHGPDFANFNDAWSQVLNILYDQNGSVYVLDWYDKNQCHHNDENGHDRSNGRIFKLVYDSQKWTPVDLQKKADEELVQLLSHKNDWFVRHARRILQERGENPTVAAQLEKSLAGNGDAPQKLRALWALHGIGGLSEKTALNQLQGKDEFVRAWAIQLLAESKTLSSSALKEFARLSNEDPSPVVRLYLASAAQRLPPNQRWEILTALNAHSEDANDHNLPLMVWYASEPLVSEDLSRALKLAVNSKLPNVLPFMVRRIAAVGSAEAFAAITQALDRVDDVKRQLEILRGLSTALQGQRKVEMPGGWAEVAAKLDKSGSADIRTLTQSLSLTFGSAEALAALRNVLVDQSAEITVRRTALESLAGVKDPSLPPLLQGLLQQEGLRAAALRALAAYDDLQTPGAILGAYASLNSNEKRDALNTLASRPTFAKPLLSAVGQAKLPAKDLTPDIIRQLRNLKNAEIDEELKKVWGVARESSEDKQKEIERYKKIYRAGGSQPGDGSRGRAIFVRTCQQCHILFDGGGKVGPDLTGSNRGEVDYILQNMVDPNAVIPNEYRASTIETKDGRVLTGIVKQQDENSLTILTANETLILPRKEIQSNQESELSMMPEGLLSALPDQEVRDLIYYLSRPGQVPLPATPDSAGHLFNGKDLTGWEGSSELWKVADGEIIGRSVSGLKQNEFLKSQLVLGDFRLVCKVKLSPDKENSGIQFRSERFGEHEMKGYQADIGAGWWGKLYEENGRAILWNKSGEPFVKLNEWNTYEIVAIGSKIRTAINGQLCVDLDDPAGAKQGIIGLQLHAGGPLEVRFKEFILELNPRFELAVGK